jgi:hypothetical protein
MSTITDTVIMTTVATSAANVFSVADVMKWIYLIVGILGLMDNAFVMCVILRSRPLRQHSRNWLIFNQSLADFCGAIMVTAVTFRTISTDLQVNCFNTFITAFTVLSIIKMCTLSENLMWL